MKRKTRVAFTEALEPRTLLSGATLDLANNQMTVNGLVQTGRTAGTWNGAGLVTSVGGFTPGLNVSTAGDVGKTTFGGESVSSGDTLVMYTWNGDANLNGMIDADDYFAIDDNFTGYTGAPGWQKGDFTYDGVVDGDDYAIIDAGYFGGGLIGVSAVDPNAYAGTAGDDRIVVTVQGGSVLISINGAQQTSYSNEIRIDGHRGNDSITVTDLSQLDDDIKVTIYGSAGNDTIVGSTAAERIFAGDGDDLVTGGDGKDTIYGDAGNDSLRGSGSNDLLDGGDGYDTLRGDAGNDNICGGANPDRLRGSDGNDRLDGGGGRDLLAGEAGDDWLNGGAGENVCDGGAGVDYMRVPGGYDQLTYSEADNADYNLDDRTGSESVNSVDTQLNTGGTVKVVTRASTGGLTKSGAGTLTLRSSNSYTGSTTISGGTLVLRSR